MFVLNTSNNTDYNGVKSRQCSDLYVMPRKRKQDSMLPQ